MKIIGITGPTGAGKTTALRVLEELGGVIIDADEVYHDLTESSVAMRKELESHFGPMYTPEGQLDRKKLGSVVFSDPEALKQLNAITHRFVGEEIDRMLDRARQEGRPAAAIDAIRLFESGMADLCDATLAITAPPEVRIRRIMAREGIPEDYARARVAAQQRDEYYVGKCGYTLVNDCATPEAFAARARALFQTIL